MAMASPVWKQFIFSPLLQKEQTATGDEERVAPKPALCAPYVEELDFSEDDGEALLLLLRYTHLQFKEIPQFPDNTLFRNVAILCDLYDCGMLKIISPFL